MIISLRRSAVELMMWLYNTGYTQSTYKLYILTIFILHAICDLMESTSSLEHFRTSRGLTQSELAMRFGMDAKSGQVTISRIEKGRQKTPGIMIALMDEIEKSEILSEENEALRSVLGIAGRAAPLT